MSCETRLLQNTSNPSASDKFGFPIYGSVYKQWYCLRESTMEEKSSKY